MRALNSSLPRAVRLALVVLEEHAGGSVQLADDDTLGAVDDEAAVVGHQGHFAHVDLLLLDLLDHLRGVRLTVIDDHLQLGAHGRCKGQAALLALAHVERRASHVVLEELHLHEAVVARDREGRQERGLQAFGLALGRRHILLQEGDIGFPLHRQQIRDVENALALAETLANTLALGEAVGGCCLRHEYSVPLRTCPAVGSCVVGDWRSRTLRPMLGGWPLPTAGGQPRHCTRARPNRFSAVGSENTAKCSARQGGTFRAVLAADRIEAHSASIPLSLTSIQPWHQPLPASSWQRRHPPWRWLP